MNDALVIDTKLHFVVDLFDGLGDKICRIKSEVPRDYSKDDVVDDIFGLVKSFEGLFGFSMDKVKYIEVKEIN